MNVIKIASFYGRQLLCSNLFILSRLLDVAFALSLASNFKDQFRRGTSQSTPPSSVFVTSELLWRFEGLQVNLLSMNNFEEEVRKWYIIDISKHEVLLNYFVIHLSGAISFIIYFCSGYDDKNH